MAEQISSRRIVEVLDDADVDALRPRLEAAARLRGYELRSAIGQEGAEAGAIYLLVLIVLGVGIVVTLLTWNEGEGRFSPNVALSIAAAVAVALTAWVVLSRQLARHTLRVLAGLVVGVLALVVGATRLFGVFASQDEPNLAVFWAVFGVAVAVAGWLLSSEVTKPWLRAFVGVSLVLGVLLLVTIGRNARIDESRDALRAETRPLLESWSGDDVKAVVASPPSRADGDEGSERLLVATALLDRMCRHGELEEHAGSDDATTCRSIRGVVARLDAAGVGVAALDLSCLDGWTFGAIDAWQREASFDRRVAALVAVTSCEAGAVNPSAEDRVVEQIRDKPLLEASPDPEGSGGTGSDPPAQTTTPVGAVVAVRAPGNDPAGAVDAAAGRSGAVASGAQQPASPTQGDVARAAVRQALTVQRSEVRAHEAIARGADEILGLASGPTDFAEFRFSGAAWVVLLAAALLWYRRLEIRAGARRLGPVDVQFEPTSGPTNGSDGSKGKNGGEPASRPPSSVAEAVFKESVIRNVPEPGAIPGSEALAPVGDLVAQTDVPHKWLIGGVIEAMRTIFATRGGYTVVFSCRPSGERTAVFVRLRDTRTGAHVASYFEESDTEEAAARQAGYWVAGWIIGRSDYVPSWGKWSEEDAATFARLSLAGGNGLDLGASGLKDPGDLDPYAINAVALARRAYAHQVSPACARPHGADRIRSRTRRERDAARRNHLAALEDLARAVHRQDRYPVARYRRGAVLGTMMFLGGTLASASGRPDRRAGSGRSEVPSTPRLRYLFGDMVLGDSLAVEIPDDADLGSWVDTLRAGGAFPGPMRTAVLRVVAEWSNRNRMAIRWGWIARLRPTERFFWKDFSRGKLKKDWEWVLKTDLCISAVRLALDAQRRLDGLCARGPEDVPVQSPDRARRRQRLRLERRLASYEEGARRRALQPDSHWQISYNLACLHAIRSMLDGTSGEGAARAHGQQAEAMEWLERCQDRSASDQLVQEWVRADGDLKPIRRRRDFETWTARLRRDRAGSKSSGWARLRSNLSL